MTRFLSNFIDSSFAFYNILRFQSHDCLFIKFQEKNFRVFRVYCAASDYVTEFVFKIMTIDTYDIIGHINNFQLFLAKARRVMPIDYSKWKDIEVRAYAISNILCSSLNFKTYCYRR